jgi:hypothetical protein
VAVQRSKRVWVVDGGRLINGRRLGDEVDTIRLNRAERE